VHFFLQLEPSLFLSGQTTSFAGSEKWPAGGMAAGWRELDYDD
jgi:hypothetical protein